jgi:predicted secreted Zn-dependent protease
VAARKEAGSETATPSLDTVTDGDKIVSATVTVAQTVELPTWSDRGRGTPTQQAEWDRFSAAIAAHEQGHVAKDVAVWAGAHRKIVGQSATDGNTTLDTISTAADTANNDYDTDTGHGLKYGTGINPNV